MKGKGKRLPSAACGDGASVGADGLCPLWKCPGRQARLPEDVAQPSQVRVRRRGSCVAQREGEVRPWHWGTRSKPGTRGRPTLPCPVPSPGPLHTFSLRGSVPLAWSCRLISAMVLGPLLSALEEKP